MSKKVSNLITDNKIVIFLSKIPEHTRWIYTAVFSLSLVIIWSFVFYLPNLFRIHKYRENIKNGREQKTALFFQVNKRKNIKKENIEIKSFLKNSVVPQSYEITDKIVTLSNKFNVVCKSIIPVKPKVALQKNLDYEVALSGEFGNLLKLLDKLQELKTSTSFKKIVCSREDNNKIEIKLTIELIKRAI